MLRSEPCIDLDGLDPICEDSVQVRSLGLEHDYAIDKAWKEEEANIDLL